MKRNKKIIKDNTYNRKKPKSATFHLLSSPRIFTIIALVFIIITLIPLAKNYSRQRLIEKEVADISQTIEEYTEGSQELQELIKYLESDQSIVEQARLNMGMKKPGESVVVIRGDVSTLDGLNEETKEEIVNWKKWLKYFFN
ncbi:MAG: septum formation initiator family protein [Clostridia bacterium]|nr:septum formation initiator family protein [Clostridia bacterium]